MPMAMPSSSRICAGRAAPRSMPAAEEGGRTVRHTGSSARCGLSLDRATALPPPAPMRRDGGVELGAAATPPALGRRRRRLQPRRGEVEAWSSVSPPLCFVRPGERVVRNV
ncbi:Os02g0809400 [Oryza sativa Japonica Group]|uniref:Os02g0809400 protein n=2 Tax=Oryza sativa subsp. japonica TaxID=39947 RepID=Q6KA79_ORYSJ|nr:hypothetical protein OsJ_08810 [Oryza sativa Japonica Group]BAD19141.1 hypothetical protein [Oryza sativa Japonica Group]BAD19256.1 hypothetical protein [Oryza sativa Japonica Group]BAS81503.1 Os02g0809400 [Oryza sativa Japonica Group]